MPQSNKYEEMNNISSFSSSLNEIRQSMINNSDIFQGHEKELISMIPVIVFAGNQSSGKSSIINRLVLDVSDIVF